MIQLTIYSRPGCHLCEEMKATVASLGFRKLNQTRDLPDTPGMQMQSTPEAPAQHRARSQDAICVAARRSDG